MSSKKDKFDKAIDESIEKKLSQRKNLLSDLVDDMHNMQKKSVMENIALDKNTNTLENVQKSEVGKVIQPSMNQETQNQQEQIEANMEDQDPGEYTGASPGEFDEYIDSTSASWQDYSPSARSENPEKYKKEIVYYEASENDSENNGEGKMKKFITLIIIIAGIAFALYIWRPWISFQEQAITISLSNQSFHSASPAKISEFAPNSEIYYNIATVDSMGSSVLTLQLYKVDKQGQASLFREDVEKNVDKSTNSFSYMLRPDYFTETGTYRLKVYLGSANEKNLSDIFTFTIR